MKHDDPSMATENVSPALSESPSKPPSESPSKPPAKWPIFLLLAAAVIVPAIFWQRVWLGAGLTDEEIMRRLRRPQNARRLQHACEQISRRMRADPQNARRFYDLLVPLADHPDGEIRYVVAWCMGEDNTRYEPFHEALLRLNADPAPRVRYNAALALARFGDPAARGVLGQMLKGYPVKAVWDGESTEGTVVELLARSDPVRPGTQLALIAAGPITGDPITGDKGQPLPVLSPLDGNLGRLSVKPGDRIRRGDPLCVIQPAGQQVYEALRALVVVGRPEDLDDVERYLQANPRFSGAARAQIQAQARLTVDAIHRRQEGRKHGES